MKKNLLIAAMGLLTMASCTNDEDVNNLIAKNDNAISFDTYVGKVTKAGGTSLPANTQFAVFAYETGTDSWATLGSSTKPNFMYHQPVSFDGTSYTYSPAKYWPIDKKVSFFAYHPYAETSPSVSIASGYNNGVAGLPILAFSAPAGDIDFLVSEVANDKTSADNIVALTFKHALSKVFFTASHDQAGDTNTKVEINTITVAGIKGNGTYTCSNGGWSVGDTPFTGSFTTGSELLIIPQDPTTLTATINYTVTTTDASVEGGQVTYDGTATNLSLALLNSAKWESNKQYNYSLKVALNKVELSATVGDWEALAVAPEIK